MRQMGTRVRSQAPTRTAMPDTTSSADHEPMKTDTGSPVRAARPAVRIWLRSPHSAVNRMTKLDGEHAERGRRGLLVGEAGDLRLLVGLLRLLLGARGQSALDHDDGSRGEQDERDAQDEPLREQGEQAARRDGDEHLDGEGGCDAEPHPQPREPRGEHQRGDERLVRELGRQDQGERRHHDGEIDHAAVSGGALPGSASSSIFGGSTSQARVGHTVGVGIDRVPDHGAGVTSSRRQISRAANS